MRDIISHVLAPQGACWSIINNDNVGPKKKQKNNDNVNNLLPIYSLAIDYNSSKLGK